MSFLFRRLSRRSSKAKGRSVSLPLPIATTHDLIISNDGGEDNNVYEHRIDELGQLLSEQGRCLDELTSSNRRISNENASLRERLATHHSVQSSSSTRTPLKNILNNNKSDESKLGQLKLKN